MISWTASARTKYADLFRYAEELNKQSMEAIGTTTTKHNPTSCIPMLVFARALQSYQGAIILTERGMIADARTLARSCTEAAIALANLVTDPNFLDKMISSQTRSQGMLAKLRLAAADATGHEGKHHRLLLEDVIREFEENKDPSVNWESAAAATGFKGIYDGIYRVTSSDSAHVTLTALARHLKDPYTLPEEPTVEFGPSERDLGETLVLLMGAMSHCLMAFGRAYRRTDVESWGTTAVTKSAELLETLNSEVR